MFMYITTGHPTHVKVQYVKKHIYSIYVVDGPCFVFQLLKGLKSPVLYFLEGLSGV